MVKLNVNYDYVIQLIRVHHNLQIFFLLPYLKPLFYSSVTYFLARAFLPSCLPKSQVTFVPFHHSFSPWDNTGKLLWSWRSSRLSFFLLSFFSPESLCQLLFWTDAEYVAQEFSPSFFFHSFISSFIYLFLHPFLSPFLFFRTACSH